MQEHHVSSQDGTRKQPTKRMTGDCILQKLAAAMHMLSLEPQWSAQGNARCGRL